MIKCSSYTILISFIVSLLTINTEAQIVADGYDYEATTSYPSYPTNHSIYLYNDLTTGSLSVSLSSETNSINWYSYTDGTWNLLQSGSDKTLNNLQETGYKVEELNGSDIINTYYCWTFMPKISSLSIDTTKHTCDSLYLASTIETKSITYYDLNTNVAVSLDYSLSYTWTSDSDEDLSSETSSSPTFSAPVEETTYTLTVDAFDDNISTSASIVIEPKAVSSGFDMTATDREYENEIQDLDNYSGSAPLSITFESTSVGNITDYEYAFVKEADDENEEYSYAPHQMSNTNFTFTESGTYNITLTVTNYNSGCSDDSTRTVEVIETKDEIEVPNVFTPNGDGVNDKFMVIYSSFKTFEMTIVNRWGRKVFSTTNPGDAWDGNIGSSKAAVGVYFYYIKATGYDDNEKLVKKGTVHLFR